MLTAVAVPRLVAGPVDLRVGRLPQRGWATPRGTHQAARPGKDLVLNDRALAVSGENRHCFVGGAGRLPPNKFDEFANARVRTPC
jgi:hypothetical protein